MVNIQLNVPRPDVNLELKAGRDVPPVTSVNGKTGVVVLDAEDVDAVPYEEFRSPLEKILDITLEEESALIVTEIGGVPLSVKNELYIEVFIPSGSVTSGNVRGLCGNTKICDGYHGALTNATNQYWHIHWKKDGGVWVSECDNFRTNNFVQPYKYMLSETYDGGSAYRSIFQYPDITNVTFGTPLPAGTSIKFFAR